MFSQNPDFRIFEDDFFSTYFYPIIMNFIYVKDEVKSILIHAKIKSTNHKSTDLSRGKFSIFSDFLKYHKN